MAPPRGVVSDCIGPRKLGGARRATPAPTAERRPRIAGNISLSFVSVVVASCVFTHAVPRPTGCMACCCVGGVSVC